MKKILFLFLVFALLSPSCKKKSEGKAGCTYKTASNYDATAEVDDGSCTFSFEGCTDPEASNYNANAVTDNGTCTYAWSKFVGTYNIAADPDTFMDAHESVVSKGPGGNEIIISNFRDDGENLRATITGNGSEFEYSDVVSGVGFIGTGYIVDGVITLDYAACEEYNYPDDCDESYDQMILTLQ